MKEHQRDVKLKHITQSALSALNIEAGHQILFDETTKATQDLYKSLLHHNFQESTGRL